MPAGTPHGSTPDGMVTIEISNYFVAPEPDPRLYLSFDRARHQAGLEHRTTAESTLHHEQNELIQPLSHEAGELQPAGEARVSWWRKTMISRSLERPDRTASRARAAISP